MKSQKHFAGWLTAALIGAAAVATAPHLFGGGGDEGVDILPFAGGGGIGPGIPPKPAFGYITVEKTANFTYDQNADWHRSGVLVAPHKLSDVFIGHLGHEPYPGLTSLDVLPKGTEHISFAGVASFVHMDGRYEMTDLDPNDIETLTLVGHWYQPAIEVIIVGVRGTHLGSIPSSFVEFDRVTAGVLQDGKVDLKRLRQQSKLSLGGTGRDVAVGVLVPGSGGYTISAWAAFNVDDSAAVYDVQSDGE